MKPKHQRLTFIIVALISVSIAISIILNNFNDNLVFFYSPSELTEKNIKQGDTIRIGGLIKKGSVITEGGNQTNFTLTDLSESIDVTYTGILPPMFREEQGMVATGSLQSDGSFKADVLLTKHDENYMPPEVADALKKSGEWKGE